ncbi:hypothetical protein C8R43DRAFT_957265 [Mycena crocata]|nr:hypothetical protein C8R43DRAFT_957265 [Mycena crocata]
MPIRDVIYGWPQKFGRATSSTETNPVNGCCQSFLIPGTFYTELAQELRDSRIDTSVASPALMRIENEVDSDSRSRLRASRSASCPAINTRPPPDRSRSTLERKIFTSARWRSGFRMSLMRGGSRMQRLHGAREPIQQAPRPVAASPRWHGLLGMGKMPVIAASLLSIRDPDSLRVHVFYARRLGHPQRAQRVAVICRGRMESLRRGGTQPMRIACGQEFMRGAPHISEDSSPHNIIEELAMVAFASHIDLSSRHLRTEPQLFKFDKPLKKLYYGLATWRVKYLGVQLSVAITCLL